MKLYDQIITQTLQAIPKEAVRRYPFDRSRIWKDKGESEVIMLRDTAFELGGSGNPSVNYTCVTTSGLIAENEIFVCGPDLTDIREDAPFARIVFLEVEDLKETEDTEAAYQAIRNIEYVRYHVFPAGYMVRVSSATNEEQVRVGKTAVKAGVRFQYIGGTYIRKYKKVPGVKRVNVLFITDRELVEKLQPMAGKADAITRTLTHILDGLPTDCGHCSMKSVCDEVDGMREMHLGRK